jgi:hypothetical protein
MWTNLKNGPVRCTHKTCVVGRRDNNPVGWEFILRSSPGSTIVQDNIFVIWGGWNGEEHKGDMWTCNLTTLEWTQQKPSVYDGHNPPESKCSISAICHNDVIYMFGGWNGWLQTNDFYAISLKFPSLKDLSIDVIRKHPRMYQHQKELIEMLSQ